GGVNCSDHEVNIKILLNQVVAAGDMTEKQRNQLLAQMTDEVAELVLRDNRQQTAAISLELCQAASLLPVHGRLLQALEKAGTLSRTLERLPDDEILGERRRQGRGLTGPELAVLLAYAKLDLCSQLLASELPDEAALAPWLSTYFPTALRARYAVEIGRHPLKREIIATQLANAVLNRMGSSFVFRLAEETRATPAQIVRAWCHADRLLGGAALWAALEALELAVEVQYGTLLELRKALERVTRWVLRLPAEGRAVRLAALERRLPALLAQAQSLSGCAGERTRLEAAGVEPALAAKVACLEAVLSLLDIARLAEDHALAEHAVATVYFGLERMLRLDWLRRLINALPRDNRWQAMARSAFRDELYQEHARLTLHVLDGAAREPAETRLAAWLDERREAVAHCGRLFDELKAMSPDFTLLSAALREVRSRLAT
ncbi:MAG TPA: NAD-glutamate dehydrogenase domain-containing protein, partial [Nevskiales bacterium]|nr:NAD-glutamate dehydrogenase domain-containing protein [Nevskiales bacterium]